MIINGRAIARDILNETKGMGQRLGRKPRVHFYAPRKTPETLSYLGIKKKSAVRAGCEFEETSELADFAHEDVDAIIVQLPLPDEMDTKAALNAIPQDKDADVLSDAARGAFETNVPDALLPPVVDAIREILERSDVPVQGAHAAVVGNGWLVGAPAATWLSHQGAEVRVLTEGDDLTLLKTADIVILGAGSPGLVHPSHLKQGVVLIDAGTSESGGAIVGDADPACAEVASVFTPVPGGVGPLAVACLFRNAATLALRRGEKAL